jgi:hypothetical protein
VFERAVKMSSQAAINPPMREWILEFNRADGGGVSSASGAEQAVAIRDQRSAGTRKFTAGSFDEAQKGL